jgi:hypothetical protein
MKIFPRAHFYRLTGLSSLILSRGICLSNRQRFVRSLRERAAVRGVR